MAKKNKLVSNGEIKSRDMTKTLKELKGFTPKQALFFINYGISGNQTRAALRTYYPDFPIDKAYTKLSEKERKQYATAAALGSTNIRLHENPQKLYMQMHGLDYAKAMSVLKEGLDTTDERAKIEWWDRLMRLQNKDVSDASVQKATTAGARFEDPEGNKFEVVITDYGKKD
jgi:hypothetical protein